MQQVCNYKLFFLETFKTFHLLQAAREGREDIVRKHLAQLHTSEGKSVLDACDASGFTPLHYAAKFNHFEILQLLVNAGACKFVVLCLCVLLPTF